MTWGETRRPPRSESAGTVSSGLAKSCLVLAIGHSLVSAGTSRAQDVESSVNLDLTTPEVEQLLDTALREAASDTQSFRFVSAGFSMTSGIALLTLGTIRLVQDPADNQIERGVGLMWLGIGAAGLTTGLLLVSRKSPEERIWKRWRARQRAGAGLSPYELGTFAGELRAAAAFRERERRLVRWTALAGAGAGALSLSLLPATSNLTDASRRNIFIVGGIFIGVGLMNFGLSFRRSGPEKAWESYRYAASSGAPRVQATLAPAAFQGGGGLSLVGIF